MTETPVVIHLAQRPGPATGLPTRTEQADLELALYAGHGEFPRIVLAPGNLEQAFSLSRQAFDMADRYQSPVIILTDQFLMDASMLLDPFDISAYTPENRVIESDADYRRYALDVEDGISPRSVPGYGQGLVLADSDEHDEWGRITESMKMRRAQNSKRLKKNEKMQANSLEPELIGPESYKHLVIGWGSTRDVLKEALDAAGSDHLACMHVKQIYPLSDKVERMIGKAEKTLLVENNATGQLGKLITRETGLGFDHKLFHDSGLPLSVETVCDAVKAWL
jgi:2-oxoglutarate ferredoxin oxidoreductase subunit alpha